MHSAVHTPDDLIGLAAAAIRAGDAEMRASLDSVGTPIYATDAAGTVTFANRACADFTGRAPQPGEDRWCVTWKLYSRDGRYLPHEECPMAVAIREKRPVRGAEAIAERPDGSRAQFRPYPTPVLDESGELVGAVNLLLDVTDPKRPAHLTAQASKCRRLAKSITDARAAEALTSLACEYENQARALEPA